MQSDSKGSSGSRSNKQSHVSLLQQAVRNKIIEDSTRGIQSFHLHDSLALSSRCSTKVIKRDKRVSQSMAVVALQNARAEQNEAAGNMLAEQAEGRNQNTDGANLSMNESFFADWDLSAAGGPLDQQKHLFVQRTFSMVRSNNLVEQTTSFQLKQIEEDSEFLLINDLGAVHESSSSDDDEDDMFAFDKPHDGADPKSSRLDYGS